MSVEIEGALAALDDGPGTLRAEIYRLRALNEQLLRITFLPLTEAEMKMVDKHCDWIRFAHAWNAVMKSRRRAL